MMNKTGTIVVALAAVLALASTILAQELKEEAKANKQTTPVLRVAFGMGLDHGDDFERVVQAADIPYEKVRPLDLGGWHGWWTREGAKGLSRSDIQSKPEFQSLAGGGVDVFVLSTLLSVPSDETWNKMTGPEDSFLAGIADVGIKNNPNYRVLWRVWLHADGGRVRDKDGKSKDVFNLEGTRKRADPKNRKRLEELVDKINEKHGKQVVLIVPTADATIKLVDLVLDGKFPGVTDPGELWVEYNMHGGRFLKVLAAYCHFAVVYGVSPEGLKPSFEGRYYSTKGSSVRHSLEGITAEQHAILQKIAWETVSKYSYAGIGK